MAITRIRTMCKTGQTAGCLVKIRRVSSVVEYSSTNPKVPCSIRGPVSYWGLGYDMRHAFMDLTLGVVHNFTKAVGV